MRHKVMDRNALVRKLKELKTKQAMIEKAWKKTGNRELLQFFVEIMPGVVDAERCSIFIHDPVDENVWVQCGTGVDERQINVPQGSSVVGRVIQTGKAIFDSDMQQQMGAHDSVAIKTGYISYNTLCVPVHGVTTKKVTGAIQAINKIGAKEFSNADLELLEKLAFHIQMHIENIYLRQELAKISTEMDRKIAALEDKLRTMGA